MAGAAGGRQQEMRDFVASLFRGSPDLSILTHAIVRKKYLDHVGQKNLSKEEKEQLKQLMEEELVQMKVDEPPDNVELRTEVQDSFKSGDRKRPRCISDTSDEEIKNEQEQKRQRIGKKLEVSSDEKDSGIDSKKQPLHGGPKLLRKFLDSSDQGDSGAEDHTAESGSDEESTKSKGKEPLQEARRERQRGSKSAKRQWNRGLQEKAGSESEEATDTGQSDLEEEVEEHRKVTKGNSLQQKDLKLREKVDKELKVTDPKGKEKNRKMNEQRGGKNKSEGGNDLSEMEKILEKKRIEWSESEEEKSLSDKAQGRVGQGTQKGSKGNESEDASGSDSDKKCSLQKKMANSRCRRKSRSIEDLSSSSEDSAGQSPMRKEGGRRASGARWSRQARNYSKPKRQPKERGRKKMQREDLSKKKLAQRIQESRRSTSEESESEADEHKSLKEKKKKGVQDSTSSNGESQSEETEKNQGQPRKVALRSHPSESESDESKDGDQRKNRMLKKRDKRTSGSNSSQEEDKLKNRGAQKSQRKSGGEEESVLDSEDSGSEFGGKKKSQSQQKRRTEKLRRRSTSKEKHGEESNEEEGSGSEEGEPTSSNQHHLGRGKKHHSGKNEDHPSIQRLKRYIRECGVWRNYKKLLAGCRSRRAQIEVLREELGSLGMKGAPSLAKCRALKQKREEAAEVASLDINNIIATEGRPKRRNVWSLYSKPQESPSSPEELPLRHRPTDWSQLRGVISSDGESS
ncbi:HIRA-interacting protein 3 isoform X1 [Python bivittatus]|uniref:HIRA-interacting protein 3 isoform X1 n=1 Tax=Python bivittatus TaxID=176946 RepID=A0A9F2NHH1_PYTBI|nr:HIRA-interacting protein 3 isoform X1 [Python bivittatus]